MIKPRDNKWYGFRRGHVDINDFPYFRPKVTRLPAKVDLRPNCPPIMDQGQLGSCTAHGITGILRYDLISSGKPDVNLSRLQLYYDERAIEGSVKEDAGAEIRDGIKSAVKTGVGDEKLWPYNINKFAAKPPASVYKSAIQFNALKYMPVQVTAADVKAALAAGFPVVMGFDVYASFESAAVSRTGMLPMPKRGEEMLGGHCVYFCGYGQKPGRFTMANSWNTDWGDKGYFYMPEAMVTPTYCADFWVVKAIG